MRVVIKPIIKPPTNPCENYREFDEVLSIDDATYPLIKIRHISRKRYVIMQVPTDCYMIIEED